MVEPCLALEARDHRRDLRRVVGDDAVDRDLAVAEIVERVVRVRRRGATQPLEAPVAERARRVAHVRDDPRVPSDVAEHAGHRPAQHGDVRPIPRSQPGVRDGRRCATRSHDARAVRHREQSDHDEASRLHHHSGFVEPRLQSVTPRSRQEANE